MFLSCLAGSWYLKYYIFFMQTRCTTGRIVLVPQFPMFKKSSRPILMNDKQNQILSINLWIKSIRIHSIRKVRKCRNLTPSKHIHSCIAMNIFHSKCRIFLQQLTNNKTFCVLSYCIQMFPIFVIMHISLHHTVMNTGLSVSKR